MPKRKTTPAPSPASRIITSDGKNFDVPEKGSLGLLALGYEGLMAWREKRKQIQQAKDNDGQKTR